jgi:hypothetical protein
MDRHDFLRIEQATKRVERAKRNKVAAARGPNLSLPTRTFWTTSAISSASVTGTTVSNSVRTLGSGTARICILDSSGHDIPDTTAADITIYNGVVMTTPASINTGLFADCAFIGGKWRVVTVHKCPT